MNRLTVNELIEAREFYYGPNAAKMINKRSWVGLCAEVVSAIAGETDHEVHYIDGWIVITRPGHMRPHFFVPPHRRFAISLYWTM